MQKLAQVEDAKRLMTEASEWSTWRWLFEKGKVRRAADLAWAALEEVDEKVRAGWSDDLKKAFHELDAQHSADGDPRGKRRYAKAKEDARNVPPEVKAKARQLKDADNEATQLRWKAEETFEVAERRLNTGLAQEGSRQAIEAWGLREKFIRKAEAAARVKASA